MGITTSGNALTLQLVIGSNVGSRVYLMAPDDTNYSMFDLKNQEFTFDMDVSKLPCGLNGVLYFVEMDADGGLSEYAGDNVSSTLCRKDIERSASPATMSSMRFILTLHCRPVPNIRLGKRIGY